MFSQSLELYKSFVHCVPYRYLCFVQFFYFFLHEYTFPSNLLSWPGHSQHPGNPLQEYHVNLNTKTHNILLNASNSSHQPRPLPAHLTPPVYVYNWDPFRQVLQQRITKESDKDFWKLSKQNVILKI